MKNLLTIIAVITAVFLLSCSGRDKTKPEWHDLFNGEDFSGWQHLGGEGIFEISDGVINAYPVMNTPSSFLCSRETYGDFILELEFKVDSRLNSGVQIRSHSTPAYLDGTVHGYQVEIDPSPRAWTGGIYDESRRGWLYTLDRPDQEEARGAFKNEEWNKFRIEAIGPNIKTWLNDIPVANLLDDETAEGFIALQLHSIPDDSSLQESCVSFRNIRIITKDPQNFCKETTAEEVAFLKNKLSDKEIEDGWFLLFDGKSSDGWRRAYREDFPDKGWKIENGELTVEASGGGESVHGGDIVSIEKFSDFELKLQVKLTPGANSGIKYFVAEAEVGHVGSAIGPEYQVLDDKIHPDAHLGPIPGSRTFASLYDLIPAKNKRVNPIGQWNNVRILAQGKHVEHWLNGFKVLEYERGSEEFRELVAISKFKDRPGFGEAEEGHILLQDHGDEVSYRSIKIRRL